MDRKVLKWFGHVERMGDEQLTKKCTSRMWVGSEGQGGQVLGG